MLLLIDNYDSFVFNLARYFERLGHTTCVFRNDEIDVDRVRALQPDAIVISPGPCTPREAGCSVDIVRALHNETPILGICLGHQAIAVAFGGNVIRADEPMHGRVSAIHHDQTGLFLGLASPLTACRYHSLVVDEPTLPACLNVTARTKEGLLMAMTHRDRPVAGLQFHPESILTEGGYPLLTNFLQLAALPPPANVPNRASELKQPATLQKPLPETPVTF